MRRHRSPRYAPEALERKLSPGGLSPAMLAGIPADVCPVPAMIGESPPTDPTGGENPDRPKGPPNGPGDPPIDEPNSPVGPAGPA